MDGHAVHGATLLRFGFSFHMDDASRLGFGFGHVLVLTVLSAIRKLGPSRGIEVIAMAPNVPYCR